MTGIVQQLHYPRNEGIIPVGRENDQVKILS